jgi:hypothetical protein
MPAKQTRAEARYRPSLVTFLDILGFREAVKKRACADVLRILKQVERFTDARKPTKEDDPEDLEFDAKVIAFSDSIVRVRPLDTKHRYGPLWHELISLVHVQGELIQFGVVLRGGISLGDTYIEDGRVFGPGMISAYETESLWAKYPRVVVSPQVLTAHAQDPRLRDRGNTVEWEQEEIAKLIRKSDDGLWFVDYLTAMEEELDDIDDYVIVLKTHKNLILDSVHKKGPEVDAVVAKHLWLAQYHNEVVSQIRGSWFKRHAVKRKELLINTKEFPALIELQQEVDRLQRDYRRRNGRMRQRRKRTSGMNRA